jgi:hypothetical protein
VRPLAARLETDWQHLVASPATARAMARWAGAAPVLAGWSGPEALRAAVHDRTHPDRADRIMAALVRLAAVDGGGDLLAVRVLVHLLIPGAVRLARSLAPLFGVPHTREAAMLAEAVVFAELAIGIRTYPWRRRPRRIAANLLLDCRQRLTRRHRRTRPEIPAGVGVDLDLRLPGTSGIGTSGIGADSIDAAEAAVALRELLDWARRRGVLDPVEIRLLVASHVHDIPIPDLVAVFGRSRSSLFATRARAERRLRHALLAQGAPPYGGRRATGPAWWRSS